MSNFEGFPSDTLRFLKDLENNNTREWFAEHKQRYEKSFLEPALSFISAMETPLSKVAPLLVAQPKKVGGSLMRIYRDTRFAKDKQPYKTNIGIQFRHQAGKDVHAPGVYLHIATDGCFLGAGVWRPPSDALRAIRKHVSDHPQSWLKIRKLKRFSSSFEVYDDRLTSAPRGFDKHDPLIDDLRLKSFLGMAPLKRQVIESAELVPTVSKLVKNATPLMTFLCEALGQPY